jgi:hypothetical protein
MKQEITFNQWKELTIKQKIKWIDTIHLHGRDGIMNGFKEWNKTYAFPNIDYNELIDHEMTHFRGTFELPNIGQMIEFLGNYLIDMLYRKDLKKWHIGINQKGDLLKWIEEKELCNGLWKACKYKLK